MMNDVLCGKGGHVRGNEEGEEGMWDIERDLEDGELLLMLLSEGGRRGLLWRGTWRVISGIVLSFCGDVKDRG